MPILLTNEDYNKGISEGISCFGDSLTQGAGATTGLIGGLSYPSYLANLLYPTLVQNFGLGGQTMQQIASRQGAKPIYITITGNVLNGANDVTITSISSQFLSWSATTTGYASGIVNGVPCLITRTVVSSVETYVIRGANNSTSAIPANSIFYPDSAFNAKDTIQVLWWGRNNVPTLTGLDLLYDKAIESMSIPRRFIIIGVLPAQTEIIGTTNYNAIIEMNNTLRTNYPNNYVESTPPTAEEMADLVYTPTSQDNTDIANGIFPTGMRSDAIHLNGFAYNIIANRVVKLIKQYSW